MSDKDWSAAQYDKFTKERKLPAVELAYAVSCGGAEIRSAIDIGCGSGFSTGAVAKAFPNAEITGIDFSEDMLAAAKKKYPDIDFSRMSVPDELEMLGRKYDLVFSNACIQWIPDHRTLIPRLFSLLNDGGVLAVQIPDQAAHPVHALIDRLAASDEWREKFPHVREHNNLTADEYYNVLESLSGDFRLWETTYYHTMPSHESIVEWYKGTGLKPYLEQLGENDKNAFLCTFLDELRRIYPLTPSGNIIFRFPRLFFTAVKA